ncbi:MAG: chondroitinase-B domain-containing protein [Bacteroidota bacterium]
MKSFFKICLCAIIVFLSVSKVQAAKFTVSSLQEFRSAHNSAMMNDSIIWETGTFSNIHMEITKSNLYIGAEVLGGTIFDGASRVTIRGDYTTLEGVQFVGGNIGTSDVINTYGSYNDFTQINIRAYTCYKYLRIREECQYCTVTYCNFENRLNLDDQNILSILVDENNPGYHKIQYCSFKNFDGIGNDMGIEPIRIGLSTQADHVSRSLVEYCYFTQCDGDGELISSKATQNVYRYNTFENNSKAELVLRHGSEAIVYGNFFLNGKGGVRVREGQNHYIYNNYFYELDDRPIYLQNASSDPLDNINITFNTIVDCSEVRLGGSGSNRPTNVTFANNIFADPDDDLFEDPTGTESWIGNIASGSIGISLPSNGMTVSDPQLVKNNAGYFGLSENSPAINAAQPGFAILPQFEGMDTIDVDILLDLMKQQRPANIEEKDLGSSEYPQDILIQPFATEENTGPSYNTSTITNVAEKGILIENFITLSPNPANEQIRIKIENELSAPTQIELLDITGKKIRTIFNDRTSLFPQVINHSIEDLVPGVYIIKASRQDKSTGRKGIQSIKFSKL